MCMPLINSPGVNVETLIMYGIYQSPHPGNLSQPHFWKSEDDTHTPKMGTWESSETPETSEFDCRGQKNLHWNFFYIIEKLSKCRCQKWPRMSHLDICSISYGKKKGRKSNWQFDSRPLKVRI